MLVGAVMLAPEAEPLFIWPGATLALGVLAGVTTVGEEQVRGVARFWAERRLPLGRLWLVKTGFHFALAARGRRHHPGGGGGRLAGASRSGRG